jgi:hypothetical protein
MGATELIMRSRTRTAGLTLIDQTAASARRTA